MRVRLLVHLESTPEGVVWWGESPDVAGFSVWSDRLNDLITRAAIALEDVLSADGRAFEGVDVELVGDRPATDNPASAELRGDLAVGAVTVGTCAVSTSQFV
jgi:hypothetical protein